MDLLVRVQIPAVAVKEVIKMREYDLEKQRIKIGFDKATSEIIYLDNLIFIKTPNEFIEKPKQKYNFRKD